MKLAVLVLLAPALAHAGDAADLATAIKSPKALKALLADQVTIGPVLFHGGTCAERFHGPVSVSGADRDTLVTCLSALALENEADLSPFAWSGNEGVLFTFTLENHKITAIGPYATTKADAAFPVIALGTIEGLAFTSSAKPGRPLQFKACSDGTRRVIKPSGNAAFDKEAAAFLAKAEIPAAVFRVDGQPQTACVVSSLR